MSVLTDDLAAIFADTSLTVSVEFAVSSSAPVQCTRGFLTSDDLPEPDAMGGLTIVTRRVLTVQEDVLDGLAQNLTITVDDVDYRIHGVRSGGRGKTKVLLA